jgi:UDP-N-acetylglucosamine 2-epimerase
MMKKSNGWKNPFGDGRAGERIIDVTMNALDH